MTRRRTAARRPYYRPRAYSNHPPCPGGCGELADECMTPGCGRPLGGFTITPPIGSREQPER